MQRDDSAINDTLEDFLGEHVLQVMLVNKMGKVESAASKGTNNLAKDREEIFSMGLRLHQSMLQEFDDEFGPVEHCVISRKNAKIVAIPLGSRNLVFVMDIKSDHEAVFRKTDGVRGYFRGKVESNPLHAEEKADV